MKTYQVEITKRITKSVKAESYEAACAAILADFFDGSNDHTAWHISEPLIRLISEEDTPC